MTRYMIHGCGKRINYINKYLMESMYEQGLKVNDILLITDVSNKGNLQSCIESYNWIANNCDESDYIWHLQDDVILSSDFVLRTRDLDNSDYPVMCGFSSCYDCYEEDNKEYTNPKCMWYSFPCMRIQNWVIKKFLEWYKKSQEKLSVYIKENKYDDTIFKQFLEEEYPDMKIKLIIPNLVDHVDYLIGGSTVNPARVIKVRSRYWDENNLVDELERKLRNACS